MSTSFRIPFAWESARERFVRPPKDERQLVIQQLVLSVVKKMGTTSLTDIRDEMPDDVPWIEAAFAIDELKKEGVLVQKSRGVYISPAQGGPV